MMRHMASVTDRQTDQIVMIFIWKALDVQEQSQFSSRNLWNGLQIDLAAPDRKCLQLQLEDGTRLALLLVLFGLNR